MSARNVFPTTDAGQRAAMSAVDPSRAKSFFQPLRHYRDYAFAGIQSLAFFGIPHGQAPGGQLDTNMEAASVLTQAMFRVDAIEVPFWSGEPLAADSEANANDVRVVAAGGRLEFRVNGELVLEEGPLGNFASPARIVTDGVMSAQAVGPVYKITPIIIPANTAFSVELKDLPALPSGVNGRIGVRLIGVRTRTS